MKAVGRITFAVFLLLVLLFWTVFTIQNPVQLDLTFLQWSSMELPVAIWLLIAFILGGFCGILLCASGFIRGKAVERQLKYEIERNKAEEFSDRKPPVLQSEDRRPMRNVESSQPRESNSTT